MLVLPLFAVFLLAPLAQGLFDFQLQAAFQTVIFFSCVLRLLSALRRGESLLGLFPGQTAAVIVVAAFSFFSMRLSPVRALIWPEWGNLAAGFLIFAFSGFLSPEDRNKTNLALRIAAWGTAALAAGQVFVLKSPQILASLTNPNALALFVVMILPLAVSWKDWWLTGAMLVILVWTQSAGAAISLIAAAGFYARRPLERAGFKKNLLLFALLAVAAALAVYQVPPQSFVDRLLWWKSAGLMFLSRPFLGFGHAAFTFVYPAYRGFTPGAACSIYAHSYYLEFLAENGIFCAVLWFGLLWSAAKKKPGPAKYSLLAAMLHSVIDFGLSVPANLWIFCHLAAPESPERAGAQIAGSGIGGISNAGSLLFPVLAAIISAAWLNLCFTHNRALRAQADAVSAYAGRDFTGAESKFKKSLEIENSPAGLEALGKIEYQLALERKDRGRLFSSAVLFERALLFNPYSASAYRDLAVIYGAAGEEKLLSGLEERKKMVFR